MDLDAPVAVASSVIGHGRWRFTVHGQGNHAGTTLLADRHDPLLVAALVVAAAREVAAAHPGTRATVGRLNPVPGGTNVIASRVDLWLDVRHPEDAVTAAVVAEVSRRAAGLATAEGCTVDVREESLSPTVDFDVPLSRRLSGVLPGAPLLATGPVTTPVSSPSGCRRPCCSRATPRASRTRPRSSAPTTTPNGDPSRWRTCWPTCWPEPSRGRVQPCPLVPS